jgi:predicted DNA-binding transcriptional regulator AlpA
MPKAAQTVDEFCADNNLCRATFYNLRKAGRGPRIMKIGSRTLISAEASSAWRRQMEDEAENHNTVG